MQDYLETRDGERPLGVYALYDLHNTVQYVGYSRNMVIAVKVIDMLPIKGVAHFHFYAHLCWRPAVLESRQTCSCLQAKGTRVHCACVYATTSKLPANIVSGMQYHCKSKSFGSTLPMTLRTLRGQPIESSQHGMLAQILHSHFNDNLL